MAEHTPGPWNADVNVYNHGGWKDATQHITIEAGETVIAYYDTACVEYPDDDVNAANARLIAATPKMLEALLNVRKLVAEAAMTGFNCKDGDWAERLFANQADLTAAINSATKDH